MAPATASALTAVPVPPARQLRRVIDIEDYTLNFKERVLVPIAADGLQLHFGGLVNHERKTSATGRGANASFVMLEGACSDEISAVIMTTRAIECGEEIRVDYGPDYFSGSRHSRKPKSIESHAPREELKWVQAGIEVSIAERRGGDEPHRKASVLAATAKHVTVSYMDVTASGRRDGDAREGNFEDIPWTNVEARFYPVPLNIARAQPQSAPTSTVPDGVSGTVMIGEVASAARKRKHDDAMIEASRRKKLKEKQEQKRKEKRELKKQQKRAKKKKAKADRAKKKKKRAKEKLAKEKKLAKAKKAKAKKKLASEKPTLLKGRSPVAIEYVKCSKCNLDRAVPHGTTPGEVATWGAWCCGDASWCELQCDEGPLGLPQGWQIFIRYTKGAGTLVPCYISPETDVRHRSLLSVKKELGSDHEWVPPRWFLKKKVPSDSKKVPMLFEDHDALSVEKPKQMEYFSDLQAKEPKELIGSYIEVLWGKDVGGRVRQKFRGRVVRYSPPTHLVLYDDGDLVQHNFSKGALLDRKHRLIETRSPTVAGWLGKPQHLAARAARAKAAAKASAKATAKASAKSAQVAARASAAARADGKPPRSRKKRVLRTVLRDVGDDDQVELFREIVQKWPLELVGSEVLIEWAGKSFYSATVTAYDAKKGHTVKYNTETHTHDFTRNHFLRRSCKVLRTMSPAATAQPVSTRRNVRVAYDDSLLGRRVMVDFDGGTILEGSIMTYDAEHEEEGKSAPFLVHFPIKGDEWMRLQSRRVTLIKTDKVTAERNRRRAALAHRRALAQIKVRSETQKIESEKDESGSESEEVKEDDESESEAKDGVDDGDKDEGGDNGSADSDDRVDDDDQGAGGDDDDDVDDDDDDDDEMEVESDHDRDAARQGGDSDRKSDDSPEVVGSPEVVCIGHKRALKGAALETGSASRSFAVSPEVVCIGHTEVVDNPEVVYVGRKRARKGAALETGSAKKRSRSKAPDEAAIALLNACRSGTRNVANRLCGLVGDGTTPADLVDTDGTNALLWACRHSWQHIATHLLSTQKDIDVNAAEKGSRATAVWLACQSRIETMRSDVGLALAQKNANMTASAKMVTGEEISVKDLIERHNIKTLMSYVLQ